MSIAESLTHAGLAHDAEVEIHWLNSETLTPEELERELQQGLRRRRRARLRAARHRGQDRRPPGSRANHGLPYFGICYGLHMAVIEFARNVCGLEGANSTEIDRRHAAPGDRPDAGPARTSRWAARCGSASGRAGWSRAPGPRDGLRRVARSPSATGTGSRSTTPTATQLAEAGLIASGVSPDGKLVEIMELEDHPFFVGVQFHPEFRSRPNRPHPLFRDFVGRRNRPLPEGAQRELPLQDRTVTYIEAPQMVDRGVVSREQ